VLIIFLQTSLLSGLVCHFCGLKTSSPARSWLWLASKLMLVSWYTSLHWPSCKWQIHRQNHRKPEEPAILFSQVLEGDKQPLIIKEYVTFAGTAVGLKNWLRITFAVDPVSLEEALGRVKSFCLRHSKQFERY